MLFTTGLQFALEPANRLQQPAPAASYRGSCRIRLATVSCIKLYWLSCRCATSGMTAAVLLFVPSLNILIKQICFVFNETHDSKRTFFEDQGATIRGLSTNYGTALQGWLQSVSSLHRFVTIRKQKI